MRDFSTLIKPPFLSGASGWILAARLERAAPTDLTALEKKALKRVGAAADRVLEVMRERDRLSPVGVGESFRALGHRWAAIHGQLAAWERLAGEDRGRRAQTMREKLFRSGIAFVRKPAENVLVESQKLLDRLEKEELEDELVGLTDLGLFREVKAAHRALADSLGVGREPVEAISTTALRESVRDLSTAVADYARVLLGGVGLDDEKGEARLLAALEPLRVHREEQARKRAGGGTEGTGGEMIEVSVADDELVGVEPEPVADDTPEVEEPDAAEPSVSPPPA